ncbi:MAG: peptide chain release factor 2 [Caldithrix sp.]|nr:peptide chain release factor 2 [Caldithrix sp.]
MIDHENLEQVKRLRKRLNELRSIFDLDRRESTVKDLEKETIQDDFWNDNENAQNVLKKITEEKSWIDSWNKCQSFVEDLEVLIELQEDESDSELENELISKIKQTEREINNLEFKKKLSGPDDKKNALLTIHPGAGGTESQDWAEMLMRMYLRYSEIHDFQTDILDMQDGDEAGVKSVTIEVNGPYAFGYLKAEAGVHRLVRISPFDANKRRHTSFASVFVLPEIDDDIDVEINQSELRIDTYRASGAGGQHVNKTDSAIRITHLPTGIVVQCQNQRSQHKNKANALKILASRLYQKKLEEQQEKKKEMEDTKRDIAWGSQIRSYVFHPYNMVKDHRTNIETSNIQQVMDGDLDMFIENYLIQFAETG